MNLGAGRFICLPCEFLQTNLCWPYFSVVCHALTCFVAVWELILCFGQDVWNISLEEWGTREAVGEACPAQLWFRIVLARCNHINPPATFSHKDVQVSNSMEKSLLNISLLIQRDINVIWLKWSNWPYTVLYRVIPSWSLMSFWKFEQIHAMRVVEFYWRSVCGAQAMPSHQTWGKFLHAAFWCRTELANHIQKPKGSHCNAFLDQEGGMQFGEPRALQ